MSRKQPRRTIHRRTIRPGQRFQVGETVCFFNRCRKGKLKLVRIGPAGVIYEPEPERKKS